VEALTLRAVPTTVAATLARQRAATRVAGAAGTRRSGFAAVPRLTRRMPGCLRVTCATNARRGAPVEDGSAWRWRPLPHRSLRRESAWSPTGEGDRSARKLRHRLVDASRRRRIGRFGVAKPDRGDLPLSLRATWVQPRARTAHVGDRSTSMRRPPPRRGLLGMGSTVAMRKAGAGCRPGSPRWCELQETLGRRRIPLCVIPGAYLRRAKRSARFTPLVDPADAGDLQFEGYPAGGHTGAWPRDGGALRRCGASGRGGCRGGWLRADDSERVSRPATVGAVPMPQSRGRRAARARRAPTLRPTASSARFALPCDARWQGKAFAVIEDRGRHARLSRARPRSLGERRQVRCCWSYLRRLCARARSAGSCEQGGCWLRDPFRDNDSRSAVLAMSASRALTAWRRDAQMADYQPGLEAVGSPSLCQPTSRLLFAKDANYSTRFARSALDAVDDRSEPSAGHTRGRARGSKYTSRAAGCGK